MFEQIYKAAQKVENSKKSTLWKENANPGFGSVPKKIVKKLPPSSPPSNPFNLTPLGRSPQNRLSSNQEVAAGLKLKKYLNTPKPNFSTLAQLNGNPSLGAKPNPFKLTPLGVSPMDKYLSTPHKKTGTTPREDFNNYFDKYQIPKPKQENFFSLLETGYNTVKNTLASGGEEATKLWEEIYKAPGRLSKLEEKAFGGAIGPPTDIGGSKTPLDILEIPSSLGSQGAKDLINSSRAPSDYSTWSPEKQKKYKKDHNLDPNALGTSFGPTDLKKILSGKKIVLPSEIPEAAGSTDKVFNFITGAALSLIMGGAFYPQATIISAAERGAINAAKQAGRSTAKAESRIIKKATKGIKQTAEQKTANEAAVNTAKKEAQQLNYNAYKAANPDTGSGLQVSFGGLPVPGITEATAKLAKGVKRVDQRYSSLTDPVKAKVRGGASVVRPTLAPTKEAAQQGYSVLRGVKTKVKAALALDTRKRDGLERFIKKQKLTTAQGDALRNEIESDNLVSPLAKLARKEIDRVTAEEKNQSISIGDVVKGPHIKVQNITDDIKSKKSQLKSDQSDFSIATVERDRVANRIKSRNEWLTQTNSWDTELGKRSLAQIQKEKDIVSNLDEKITTLKSSIDTRVIEIEVAERKLNKAGVDAANAPKGYWPHKKGKVYRSRKGGRRASSTGSSKKTSAEYNRTDNRPLSKINAENEAPKFNEDFGSVLITHLFEASQRTQRAILDKEIWAKGGRSIGPDDSLVGGGKTAHYNDEGYYVWDGKLQKLKAVDKWESGAKAYRTREIEDLHNIFTNAPSLPVFEWIDKFQNVWKKIATATPGFNLRNMYGDLTQAALNSNLAYVVKNLGSSGRVVRRLSQIDKSYGNPLVPLAAPKKTLRELLGLKRGTHKIIDKFGNVTRISDDELINLGIERGIGRQGFVGGDVNESPSFLDKKEIITNKDGEVVAVNIKNGKFLGRLRTDGTRRWRQNREDLARFITLKHGLEKGLTPDQAATRALEVHFDYTDLTKVERAVFHRVMPFYTWTARNIPYQAKKIVTNPGKYAAFDTFTRETAKLFGYPVDWMDYVTAKVNNLLPVPIPDDKLVTVGIPTADARYLTGFMHFAAQSTTDPDSIPEGFVKLLENWAQAAGNLIGPAKLPIELITGYSIFYGGQITKEFENGSDLIKGPDLFLTLLDKFGLANIIGAKKAKDGTWMWPKKVEYTLSSIMPGGPDALLAVDANGDLLKFSRTLTGVSFISNDAKKKAQKIYGDLTEQEKELNGRKQNLEDLGYGSTPEHRRLVALIKKKRAEIERVKPQLGGKIKRITPSPSPASDGPTRGGGLGNSNILGLGRGGGLR